MDADTHYEECDFDDEDLAAADRAWDALAGDDASDLTTDAASEATKAVAGDAA